MFIEAFKDFRYCTTVRCHKWFRLKLTQKKKKEKRNLIDKQS